MRKLRNITVVAVLGIAFVSAVGLLVMGGNTQAQTEYGARCRSAQQYLRGTMREQDIQTRVNRLQAYQFVHKRMDVFVQRLENNDQAYAVELRAQTDQLNELIDNFKQHYEEYDQARVAVTKVQNCSENLPEFTRLLQDARQKRQLVNEDVVAIDTLLESGVKGTVTGLYSSLLESEAAGGARE